MAVMDLGVHGTVAVLANQHPDLVTHVVSDERQAHDVLIGVRTAGARTEAERGGRGEGEGAVDRQVQRVNHGQDLRRGRDRRSEVVQRS